MDDNTFLGRGWCFPPEFSFDDRKVKMVTDVDDIDESLTILLSTTPGERVMQPDYGCRIKAMVFEEINQSILTQIRHAIEQAILFFEPRIILEEIDIDTHQSLEGRLSIHLDYTVITTNSRRNKVYPFYILEGTLVDL
ncbi:GPW/gp25 family protein [Shewanella surugensis]|uniref:GPW/gp25 family protein n=1 Tax=Shewanella surugensis TaxID=212020 RepID=A0ABT0L7T0_9GAMM|nr:GPW/gp25 family protein [Shewanella surugensis]MCL1123742.1 GPW/gp25 family protein [Shewanella surugensis]